MAAEEARISIAIIGAGISSLSLARGLLKHKDISIRIHEARAQVGQHDGSGVGIGPNGQNALGSIDPELLQCLYRAGGVENKPSVSIYLAQGQQAGQEVVEVQSDPAQRTVRRNVLLDELRKALPEEIIVTGKRLVSIEERPDQIRLAFEDGEVVNVDAVVGADGINSVVRQHIHSGKPPEWQHGFNTRIVIPMAEAKSVFGDAYCSKLTQTGWVGIGGFCLTDMADNGEAMQVIAGFFTPGNPTKEVFGKAWVEVSKEFWTSRLKDWGWIGEKISEVIERQDKVFAACRRSTDETPVYSRGRICLAGDAAGAFAPALGAGAGQAVEDALVLSTILTCVNGTDELVKAFRVYDQMRLPRRQFVATESNKQLRKITGVMDGIGTDKEKLKEAILEPYKQLFNFDLEGEMEKARELVG